MRKTLLIFCSIFFSISSRSQPADSTAIIIRQVADNILAEASFTFEGIYNHQIYTSYKEIPDTVEVKFKTQYGNWHYSNGVLNLAMLDMGGYFKDEKYNNYTLNHIKFGFDNYKWFQRHFKNDRPHYKYPFGEIWTMDELDDFGSMGASVIEANQLRKDTINENYFNKAAHHLLTERLRMDDGTWIRNWPQKNTIWADDLYMGISFLSRMGKYTGNMVYFDDAVNQVNHFYKYLWNDNKELFYHCYYTDINKNGVAFWGRSNGWTMLAQTQLLKYLPANHPKRQMLIQLLQKQIRGIAKYQSANGLWRQLLDKPDSYQESSCTAMFTYCIATAINNGWLDKRYTSIAQRGWEGLVKNMLTSDYKIKGVCIGTGIEDNLPFYYNRPTVTNNKHGTGIFLQAGIEILKMQKLNSLK